MLENVRFQVEKKDKQIKVLYEKESMRLSELQRKIKEQNIPVMIIFEGWGAAGKGTLINELIRTLDPRGFNVFTTHLPQGEDRYWPFLYRFWIRTPAAGRINIFDHSWYDELFETCATENKISRKVLSMIDDVNVFEEQLYENGELIIKFFLHISRDEQKKRIKSLLHSQSEKWKVEERDLKQNQDYERYMKGFERIMEKTDTQSRWNVISSQDKKSAAFQIVKTVASELEQAVLGRETAVQVKKNIVINSETVTSAILDSTDHTLSISEKEYKKELKDLQMELREIQNKMYLKRIPLVIVFEGWDAAGKGGNIKRITQELDPRGYEVIPVGAPKDAEREHYYLWRFWIKIPKAGHIAIFDRSWYGRVLVERVEGFCSGNEYKRAYKEINDFESQLINYGAAVVKFWLDISKEEQLKRFNERQNDPGKNWKITEEDWRNREKWDLYKPAVEEMLLRTSTSYAPWTVVESDDKYYARIKTLKTIVQTMKKKL